MNTLETVNQGLTLLLHGYSGDWETLTQVEQKKLVARAKTIITLGYGMLRKLEAPEEIKLVAPQHRLMLSDA